MGLESGVTYIEDLVATNPDGATDTLDEADDHLRNIKTAVQGSLPNLGAAAVTKTAAEINDLVDRASAQTITGVKTIEDPVITYQSLTNVTPVFLPTPVIILNYTTLAAQTQTAIDVSAHLPVGVSASAAIIHSAMNVSSTKLSAGTVVFKLSVANPSETISGSGVYKKLEVRAHADIDNGRGTFSSCQFDVGLSANEFDYEIDYTNLSPSGTSTVSIAMYIVGYYV